jgi:hypothetical protein
MELGVLLIITTNATHRRKPPNFGFLSSASPIHRKLLQPKNLGNAGETIGEGINC